MIVKLVSDGSGGLLCVLEQTSDLSRLNVDAPSGTPYSEIAGFLQDSEFGRGVVSDDSTVWLRVDSLARELQLSTASPDVDGFGRLVDHARKRGWLDATAENVRVRLVYY